ncbi:gamma-glutamyltransferase [Enterobacter hormaechei]
MVQPAIRLARDGFVVNDALADDLKTYGSEVIPNHENSKAIFWKDGEPLKKGDKLVQKNLAKTSRTDCRKRSGCLLIRADCRSDRG